MTRTAEEWRERNAAREATWNESEAAVGGSIFDDPPNGTYQGTVYGFDFLDLDAGDFLKIELQVAHGDHQGKVTGDLYSLDNPDRVKYTKGALKTLGLNVDETPLQQIYPGSPLLDSLLDVPVEFTVKRSTKSFKDDGSPYVNIYINKRLGDALNGGSVPASDVPFDDRDFAPAPAQGPLDPDDIPF